MDAVALERGRDDATIRNQFKSIFAKAGIGRQSELVVLLSGVSVVQAQILNKATHYRESPVLAQRRSLLARRLAR
jgi:hypothetical protein